MNKDDFIKELLFTGNIVQDSDDSVPWPEREDRFNRYIELLDSIRGDEGIEIAQAIIKSMQAKDDYGAYQTTQSTLGRFPNTLYLQAMIIELPRLINNNPDWAGELLCSLANSINTKYENDIALFKELLVQTEVGVSSVIHNYIKQQEQDGWLEHRVGVLN